MRTVHAQAAERQEITAQVTSNVKADTEVAKQLARVRWTDRDGTVRTGTARVKSGTPHGATVRVWVDRDGNLAGPPMNTLNATANGWFVGSMTALGVVVGVHAAQAGVLLVLDRRRYAQWDAEWDLVEPLWSARFRR